MTLLLESGGFEILPANTGLDGVEKARSALPDIILLDIQLPDIDGFEVLQRLQNDDAIKNIPVIAITSSAMSGNRQRLLTAGCKGYIEKPIDPVHIVEQIKVYMRG